MKISMICAFGNQRQIGLDNKLLWHIKEDLKNFKSITLGKTIVMGRKTYDSIGRPLPGRKTIVLSRSNIEIDGVKTARSVESAISIAKESGEAELVICGGEQIYNLFLDKTEILYLSKVDYNGKADAYFPEIDLEKWNKEEEIEYEKTEKSLKWTYLKYSRS